MSSHPFDRILTPGIPASADEACFATGEGASPRPFQVKLDRRQALAAMLAASGAAFASSTPLLAQEAGPVGRRDLPTYDGRGLFIVQSKFGDLWQRATRERLNVLGPFVEGVKGAGAAKVIEAVERGEEAPPPPPIPDAGGAEVGGGGAARPSGYLAWLTEAEARDLLKEMAVALVAPYVPSLKVVAPLDAAARKAAIVSLAPNAWERTPPAGTFADTDVVADELQKSLAAVVADIVVDVRERSFVVRRKGGDTIGDDVLAILIAHPQVAAVEWEALATTMALGEEAGAGDAPMPSTQAVGEEGGVIDATTFALGEEGANATTFAFGEEGGTTFALGEEGGTTYAIGEEGGVTTYALGEEGGATTFALGEEGGGVTTMAFGEEGGANPTTLALGEEGGGVPTTKALGEEGGGIPHKPPATTQAFGEEGGGVPSTRAFGEEGGGGRPTPTPRPPVNPGPRTTMALGEEGGGGGSGSGPGGGRTRRGS